MKVVMPNANFIYAGHTGASLRCVNHVHPLNVCHVLMWVRCSCVPLSWVNLLGGVVSYVCWVIMCARYVAK